MTNKTQRCRSCNAILQSELLINDKLGSNIDVCILCISGAVNEILQEEKEKSYRHLTEMEAKVEPGAVAALEEESSSDGSDSYTSGEFQLQPRRDDQTFPGDAEPQPFPGNGSDDEEVEED